MVCIKMGLPKPSLYALREPMVLILIGCAVLLHPFDCEIDQLALGEEQCLSLPNLSANMLTCHTFKITADLLDPHRIERYPHTRPIALLYL